MMNTRMAFLTALIAAGALSACVHEVVNPVMSNQAQTSVSGDAVNLTIDSVKNRENGVHVAAWLTNNTNKPVFTTTSSYKLTFNGVTYTPHADQGFVQVAPGQKLRIVLVFDLPADTNRTGQVALAINPVYQGAVEGTQRTKLTAMQVDLSLTDRVTQ